MVSDPAMLVLLLLAGHALADYPLQGQFLAEGKNRHTAIGREFWPHALAAHSLIHGGMVAAITGSALLGAVEAGVHAVTDWLKCEGRIGLHADQAIHIACKLIFAAVVLA